MTTPSQEQPQDTPEPSNEQRPEGWAAAMLLRPPIVKRPPSRSLRILRRYHAVKEENKQLKYENSHDDLTGLLTRKEAEKVIAERQKAGIAIGVLFIDLDNFKLINDKVSHDKGDQVLILTSNHLNDAFRRQGDDVVSLVGRWGGDEIIVIADLIDPPDDSVPDRRQGLSLQERMENLTKYAGSVTKNIEDEANKDPQVREQNFGISTGGAIGDPENPMSSRELVLNAEQAMKEVKAAKGVAR